MNSRQRLMAILNKEKGQDRPAWSPLIDGYYLSSLPKDKDIIDVFREINADVMERHIFTWNSNFENKKIGVDSNNDNKIEFTENGVIVRKELRNVEKGTLSIEEFEIPGHILTMKSIYTKESPFIPFPLEHYIKTPDDIEAYIYVKEREKYTEKFAGFTKEDKRISEYGIATDTGPTSPIQLIIQHLTGIEEFYTLFLSDHPKKLEKLIEVIHQKNIEAYNLIAKSPAKVVINYENTSTTLVSPTIYEKYSLSYIDDYTDILHKEDKIYLTHRCGKLKGLVDLLRKGKDDGIVDISPAPTGDLDIWDALEAWPDKIVQGGLDPTSLTQWSADKLKDYVNLILNRANGTDRLIIGSADATPKDAKFENLKVVGEVIVNAGQSNFKKQDFKEK